MSRVTYNANTVGGQMIAKGIDSIRKGRDLLERGVALANSVSAGGVSPALLEGSAEFQIPIAGGAAFYTAIDNARVNAATVSDASIADLDNGG